jgi:hypothetical protein
MSSTYRILCLSHDPAVDIDPGHAGFQTEAGALEMVARMRIEQDMDHGPCDLLVGAYSYPLWCVTCPGVPIGQTAKSGCTHREHRAIEVRWLRLAAAVARLAPDEFPDLMIGQSCWSSQRLHRLREAIAR